MAYVYFLLVAAIWSASFLLMKKATLAYSPLMVGAWRVFIGALVLAAFVRVGQSAAGSTRWRRDWPWWLFVVLAGYVWPYALQPWLIERVGSAFVGIFVSFTPLFTVLAGIPILGVKPRARQTVGVIGALACITLLMWDGLQRQFSPWVLLLGATVPLGYALTNTVMRRSLNHVSPLWMTFVSLAGASLVLLPLAYASEGKPPVEAHVQWLAIGSITVLGALGTGLAIYLFNWLVQQRGPLFAGMVTNLTPVGAILLAWLDGEVVTQRQAGAAMGIVCMVALVQYGGDWPRRETLVDET